MKKITILFILLFSIVVSSQAFAGNEAVLGSWDCEVYVDMSYPFELAFKEVDGNLSGKSSRDGGEADLISVKLEAEKLTFQIDSPEVGVIDFDVKVSEAKLTGTAGNDMFVGDLTCKKKAE
jgi:hypothetical protein